MADFFDFLQGIIVTSSLLCVILLKRKDRTYLATRFMIAGVSSFGIYALSIFTYDEIATPLAVEILLRLSMIATLLGATFIFFSMRCVAKSSFWFKNPWHWIPFGVIDLTMAIFLIVTDVVQEITPTQDGGVNIRTDLISTAVLGLGVLSYLVMSLYNVGRFGLQVKDLPLPQKSKMRIFFTGILFAILSLFATITSQLPMFSEFVGELLDYLFFLLLAASITIITAGFVRKEK